MEEEMEVSIIGKEIESVMTYRQGFKHPRGLCVNNKDEIITCNPGHFI